MLVPIKREICHECYVTPQGQYLSGVSIGDNVNNNFNFTLYHVPHNKQATTLATFLMFNGKIVRYDSMYQLANAIFIC